MKLVALQDNLSKVKAVEDAVQQMLRFPDDVQQLAASELQKQREIRKRKIKESEESEQNRLNARKKSPDSSETEKRGRTQPKEIVTEEGSRQCTIDFRV